MPFLPLYASLPVTDLPVYGLPASSRGLELLHIRQFAGASDNSGTATSVTATFPRNLEPGSILVVCHGASITTTLSLATADAVRTWDRWHTNGGSDPTIAVDAGRVVDPLQRDVTSSGGAGTFRGMAMLELTGASGILDQLASGVDSTAKSITPTMKAPRGSVA